MTTKFIRYLSILFIFGIMLSLIACAQKSQLTPQEARNIAKEAYVYGFPMVVNYKTMYMYALNEESPEFKGSFNELSCDARLFTPEDKAIVTPNSDTPYCMFWVDLRQEPQVISVPEMEKDRFYHFQLIDLYTHNFAYIGTLTTGNKAGSYLMVRQGWQGDKPDGIDGVIPCETDLFFIVVRTQLMDENDLDNVKQIQDAYRLQGLSAFQGNTFPKRSAPDDFPEWNEGNQFTAQAFSYLDVMLKLITPVDKEKPLLKKFARLGIGTEGGFDINRFSPQVQKAINEGVKEGFAEIEAFIQKVGSDPLASAKIFGTRAFLTESARNNYGLDEFFVLRAASAHTGLYGNSGYEAIYPSYLSESPGIPYDASENKYTMTFKKGQLPPVKAFWSLSIYDGKTQLFIHNPLDRYLLNSNMLDDFVYNDDGSLTLYIQKESPGAALKANWLPAPDGPFYCVMRLYGPEDAALSGEWVNPSLVKTD